MSSLERRKNRWTNTPADVHKDTVVVIGMADLVNLHLLTVA